MRGKSYSRPSGVVVIERLPASSPATRRESHDRDSTLAEFLAYLTEPDTSDTERSPDRSAPARVNRLKVQTNLRAAQRMSAELPKLAAQLNDAWRELRRQLALAARMSA